MKNDQQQLSDEEEVTVPRVVRRKRWLVIGGVVVMGLVVVGGILWWWLGSDGYEQSERGPQAELPLAQDQVPGEEEPGEDQERGDDLERPSSDRSGQRGPEETEEVEAPAATPDPEAIVADENGRNLGVLVRLTTQPRLQLTMERVERTNSRETISFYEPAEGQPHSLLQVFSPGAEEPEVERAFALPTDILAEAPGTAPQRVSIPESTAYLVVPLPATGVQEVRITAPSDGAVLDRQEFVVPPLADAPGEREGSWWARLRPDVARAQSGGDPADDGVFTILVINEVGATGSLANAEQATRDILTVEPWAEFSGQVEIVARENSRPLDCVNQDILGTGASGYPLCPNAGVITQVASSIIDNWDTIVVATQNPCACGTVSDFAPITAVGGGAAGPLIVHELGHSVGKMADEYGYQYGGFFIDRTPNCFASRNACEDNLEPFANEPGGQCSLGCNLTTNWRPANRIMHNSYEILSFGPYEQCLMRNRIIEVVGGEKDDRCRDDSEEEEEEPEGFYWGWRR